MIKNDIQLPDFDIIPYQSFHSSGEDQEVKVDSKSGKSESPDVQIMISGQSDTINISQRSIEPEQDPQSPFIKVESVKQTK